MGRRFGRNEGQRHNMTRSERVESRGKESQTHADNATNEGDRRQYQSEADACKRMAEEHRKSGQ